MTNSALKTDAQAAATGEVRAVRLWRRDKNNLRQ